jgi:proteasome lid subunit RPN8/RPN11
MTTMVEKKFVVEIVYNGVTKPLQVQPEEQVTALLQKAIATFGITQNPHLLSLFRQDGNVVPENESIERAGLKPGEVLLLRPNAVKGGGGLLRLARDIVRTTFHALLECGRGECECAVYWTGPTGEDLVDGHEHPIHRRSPFGYEIDDHWLTEFWKRLATSKRSIKVQVHTHPGEAFHSATDDRWPIVSQPGFVSIVIPDFAAGDPSLDRAWVGRLQADGTWRRLASATEAVILA